MAERYETRNVYGRPLIVCILEDGTEGAARLPANGDESIARQRALDRARALQSASAKATADMGAKRK